MYPKSKWHVRCVVKIVIQNRKSSFGWSKIVFILYIYIYIYIFFTYINALRFFKGRHEFKKEH